MPGMDFPLVGLEILGELLPEYLPGVAEFFPRERHESTTLVDAAPTAQVSQWNQDSRVPIVAWDIPHSSRLVLAGGDDRASEAA